MVAREQSRALRDSNSPLGLTATLREKERGGGWVGGNTEGFWEH